MSGWPNVGYPQWPPFVMGGWFPTAWFPSRWYHPYLGSRMVNDAAALATLMSTTRQRWYPTAGLADIPRTSEEADWVIDLDRIYRLQAQGITGLPTPPANNATTQWVMNRRSAAWSAVMQQGYWLTPLVAAAASQMAGPAPVSEGRAPGHTPAPGQAGDDASTQARSEEVPPTQ